MQIGVQTHFSQGWPLSLFNTIEALGISSIRDSIRWSGFETSPGVYQLSDSAQSFLAEVSDHQVGATMVLALTNSLYDQGMTPYTAEGRSAFAQYAVNLIAQSGGTIKTVEVWNEANGDAFVTGPASTDNAAFYALLLKETYAAIKAAFPAVTVLGGAGLTVGLGYFHDLFESGALQAMDGIVIHPYREHPEFLDREIADLNLLMEQYGGAKPIHATEFGSAFEDPADAPAYLIKAATLMASAHVASASWYALIDQNGFENMGLVQQDGTAKPALAAFELVQDELLPLGDPVRIDLGDSSIYAFAYSPTMHVLWGNGTPISFGDDVVIRSATGEILTGIDRLSHEPIIVDGTFQPVIGVTDIVSNSFYNFYDATWSHFGLAADGSVMALEKVDWDWTSYLGSRWSKPLMIRPDEVTPGGGEGAPIFAVNRYTSPEDAVLRLAGTIEVGGKSQDGVELRVSVNGGLAYSAVITGAFDLSDVVVGLKTGDTLDIAVGPNGTTSGDQTKLAIDLVRVAAAARSIVDSDAADNFVSVDAKPSTLVGILARDLSATGSVAYSLVNPTGEFAIDAVTGEISTASALGGGGLRALTVAATAADGTVSYSTFTVSVANLVKGSDSADTLRSTAADDRIVGLGGDDKLHAGVGKDTLIGGKGNDTYYVTGSAVVVEAAGEGTDKVVTSSSHTLGANVEQLVLLGSAAVDGTGNGLDNWLEGNGAANILTGGAGNDGFLGHGGADIFVGGTGNDTFYIRDPLTKVVELNGEGTDWVTSTVSYALTANVENLTLEGSAAIDGTGNELANRIQGNAGANILVGGGGNDTLFANGGKDVLKGGTGDDSYYVSAGTTAVEFAGEGKDRVYSAVSYALSTNFEDLFLTGGAAANGTGTELANRIEGNSGDNILVGGGGSDVLVANGGRDLLKGGKGDDSYYVSAGTTIVEFASEGKDRVVSSVGFTLSANIEDLILTGTGSINATGNAQDNWLEGNAGNNVLSGGAGNDGFLGNGGTDTFIGGAGNDTFYVRSTQTSIVEKAGEGTELVYSTVGFTLAAEVESLTLEGTAAISGTGNAAANRIQGNSGDNLINGKAGSDTLIGGAGADSFVFDTALKTAGIDRIVDFDTSDVLRLDDAVFRAFAGQAGTSPIDAEFAYGKVATTKGQHLVYDKAAGALYYDADGAGGAAAVQFASLKAGTILDKSDFLIF